MKYQGELALEEEVLQQLESQGYERVNINSYKQLVQNFRAILNERNKENLNNTPLSDAEFSRLMVDISDKSVFESAMQLRDSYTLERDDETKVYLYFFDTDHWCQNKFQVTHQVSVEDQFKGRYDVTILINGLPLVQIELKRSGIAITQAFNQIERYRKHNYRGLFRFIQLFVVSNKKKRVTMRIATRKSLKALCSIGAMPKIVVSITLKNLSRPSLIVVALRK